MERNAAMLLMKTGRKYCRFARIWRLFPYQACIMDFVRLKAYLRKRGNMIDDFDLLIGATAIANGLILVSENEKHFVRIPEIKLENWVNR